MKIKQNFKTLLLIIYFLFSGLVPVGLYANELNITPPPPVPTPGMGNQEQGNSNQETTETAPPVVNDNNLQEVNLDDVETVPRSGGAGFFGFVLVVLIISLGFYFYYMKIYSRNKMNIAEKRIKNKL